MVGLPPGAFDWRLVSGPSRTPFWIYPDLHILMLVHVGRKGTSSKAHFFSEREHIGITASTLHPSLWYFLKQLSPSLEPPFCRPSESWEWRPEWAWWVRKRVRRPGFRQACSYTEWLMVSVGSRRACLERTLKHWGQTWLPGTSPAWTPPWSPDLYNQHLSPDLHWEAELISQTWPTPKQTPDFPPKLVPLQSFPSQ